MKDIDPKIRDHRPTYATISIGATATGDAPDAASRKRWVEVLLTTERCCTLCHEVIRDGRCRCIIG